MPGQLIRLRREQLGLAQKEVAARLHMSQSTYSRIENQQVSLTIERARRIATELRCPIDDFLPGHAVLQNNAHLSDEALTEKINRIVRIHVEELKQWLLKQSPEPEMKRRSRSGRADK